ncbi:phospholipase [Rhizobium sp. AC44/96]|uniref:phospholipase D-like domain-containing protein n=1 Tax=unclassified Rhizobium TaxID=2613769 RepID=UPI00080FCCFA|nr:MULTISPECIES: phospholipase D-like domain-containing protein [unclassified Rhizobium]MDM9623281.1 phospholipase D-like domain-containing protein [Rhizobium sp. S96]OCJ12862.1 phospholipase [Rhizobium sp. AC44/96]
MTIFQVTGKQQRGAGGTGYLAAAKRTTALDRCSSGPAIIVEGRNAWSRAKAPHASFLIDGSSYFSAVDAAVREARHTIWIVGWDFNPDIRLRPRVSSETLGELLISVAEARPDLQIRILVWGMGPIYSGKSFSLFRENALSIHPQISLRFDLKHPIRGCHHQKLVAIDDSIAFLGGIDLTARRWDEPDHRADNPLRVAPNGSPYGPVHDIQAVVSGEAARLVGDVARRRWKHATREVVERSPRHLIWPRSVSPDLHDADVAVALTEPGFFGKRGRHEAIRLTRDAIRSARQSIYIETQYLASFSVARTIARRLKEADGLEIVILVTRSSHGLIEKLTMGGNRDRVIRRLKRMDRHGKLRVFYAATSGLNGGEQEITVHSKVIIIDDRFIRIGSSNLNNRSEGLDTECDLAVEARDETQRTAIASLRNKLLAEHLGSSPEVVAQTLSEHGSMISCVDALNVGSRGLRDFSINLAAGEISPMPGTSLVDPKMPFYPLRRLRPVFSSLRTTLGAIF